MKVRPKFADCLHCRRAVPTLDYFMLREDVWLSVHTTDRGVMHLECVEERLGRTLRRTDFATQESLNRMMCQLSPLLRSRYSPSRQELRGAQRILSLCEARGCLDSTAEEVSSPRRGSDTRVETCRTQPIRITGATPRRLRLSSTPRKSHTAICWSFSSRFMIRPL